MEVSKFLLTEVAPWPPRRMLQMIIFIARPLPDISISDDEIEKCFRVGRSLKDGRLNGLFRFARGYRYGSGVRFSFDIGLRDPSMPAPLQVPITLIVTEEGGMTF